MRRAPNGLTQGTAGQTFLSGDDGQLCELARIPLSLYLSLWARASAEQAQRCRRSYFDRNLEILA